MSALLQESGDQLLQESGDLLLLEVAGALSPPNIPHIREKPPLRLHLALETPSGRRYRWGQDEPDPANTFAGLRHSSTMPGGYESLDCTLPRRPGTDYTDLDRLSTLRVFGAGGEEAGEYRLERAPRTSGDQMAVAPSAVGWQAHLDDDKTIRQIYVDRDLGRWGGMSVQRRLGLLAGSPAYATFDPAVEPDATTGEPSLRTAIQGPWVNRAVCPSLYDAGPGNLIEDLYYAWKRGATVSSAPDSFQWLVRGADNDTMSTSLETTGDLQAAGPGAGTLAFTDPKRFLEVLISHEATGGADGVEYPIFWTCLAAYGDHGLTKRGEASATGAQGFYGSDVVAHAVSKFAPLLNFTEGVTLLPSGFVIPHLAFLEPTTASEIVRQASRFGLQDWAVWDNKTFWWHDRGAAGTRWRARIGPARLEETGPQTDRLWESVIVSYQDVDGTTRTVGPPGSGADTEDATLKDSDPANPANQLGIVRRDLLSMGTTTPAGAIEVGRRFLEETRRLDRSGQATLVGHVEDDRGVLHPYWKVRAGDQIAFVDASDNSYRRIVKVDHTYASRSCQIDLDAPPEGLQALLERLGVVLIPLGVS